MTYWVAFCVSMLTVLVVVACVIVRRDLRWAAEDDSRLADELLHPAPQAVTLAQAQSTYHVSATKSRAAVWVHLVCGDATMRNTLPNGVSVEVTDPVEQWRYVYRNTSFECLN